MKQNFFKTLTEALTAVRDYLVESRCVLAFPDDAFQPWCIGGVAYGQTVDRALELSEFKGKPVNRRFPHSLRLSIYRMDSGTYEAVAYVS